MAEARFHRHHGGRLRPGPLVHRSDPQGPFGHLFIERAVHEVAAVARARGVALAADVESKILAFIDSLPDAIKPSFLLDLESGGPTEIDDLCGAVSRLGREAGVGTPVHDVATAALSAR